MLGQLRPGQYHVTLVPAWRCSALPILQHWAPDFLTALQPLSSPLPGEHTTNHHHILTLHPSPGQRSRERPRLPARALAAKSEPAAASLLGPRQVPGVAGVSRRPCWGGAWRGCGGGGLQEAVAGAGGWRWCCPGAAWPRTERGLGPAEVRQSPHRGRPPARPRLATSLVPAPSPRG